MENSQLNIAIVCLKMQIFSVASSDSAKILKDMATGCEFNKIRVVICHSCNSHESIYKDNKFFDIGDRSITHDPISAI